MTDAAETLERLYREEGAKLWRSLFAFSGDPEVASDALGEAFAQALARGGAIARPDAWIWTASFRIAAGLLKARARSGTPPADASYEMPAPVVDLVAALWMPPKQRMAIVFHDYADRPTHEVARALDSSKATVHVHLSQGRRRLRMLLGDADE